MPVPLVDIDVLIDAFHGKLAALDSLNIHRDRDDLAKNQRDFRYIAGIQLLPYP